MTWEKESETTFAQKGIQWFDRATLTAEGIEFTTTEHHGNTYVVTPPVAVVRELLRLWDARQSARREQIADSGVPTLGIDSPD